MQPRTCQVPAAVTEHTHTSSSECQKPALGGRLGQHLAVAPSPDASLPASPTVVSLAATKGLVGWYRRGSPCTQHGGCFALLNGPKKPETPSACNQRRLQILAHFFFSV